MTKKQSIILAALLVTLNLLFTSCGDSKQKSNLSPAQTFTAFRDAVKKHDVEGFKNLLSKKSLKSLEDEPTHQGKQSFDEYLKGFVDRLSSEEGLSMMGFNEKIVDGKIEGDKATVMFLMGGSEKTEIFWKIIKEDGEWKVVLPGFE